MAKEKLTTLTQASTISVASLAATDLVASSFGSDVDQDGMLVTARFMGSIFTDTGGVRDIANAVFGIAQPGISAADAELSIEAVPDDIYDFIEVERAGRYVRPLTMFGPAFGDATSGYGANFDTGWIKVLLDFHSDLTTMMVLWIYNIGTGAFDADTAVRTFTQARVRWQT